MGVAVAAPPKVPTSDIQPSDQVPEPLLQRLRVSVAASNDRPSVLYDENTQFRGGLARDIIDHLAAHLSLSPDYLDIPRARIEPWLRTDRIDAACFLAPAWAAQPQSLYWSPPLFEIRQVVVSPRDSPAIRQAEDLFGKRLGTQLNYVYPELQPYFADGRILRMDAPSSLSNVAKLLRHRIDAYIDVDLAILYAQRAGELPLPVRIDPLWAPANPVHCAFSTAFAARHPALGGILRNAVDSGQVERWIEHYTGRRPVPSKPAARLD